MLFYASGRVLVLIIRPEERLSHEVGHTAPRSGRHSALVLILRVSVKLARFSHTIGHVAVNLLKVEARLSS